MSAVAVAVIIGFVLCALAIRALSTVVQARDARAWQSVATDPVRIAGDTPWRAMIKE
ncbi:hypothetical protein ACQP0C_11635 [Nocardia sp. CA-129566]|uniref:hypothetical protein n=1 Tax=Nocardia sp. CA-129566 TaxID=3239976 RepID=UPI003D977F73